MPAGRARSAAAFWSVSASTEWRGHKDWVCSNVIAFLQGGPLYLIYQNTPTEWPLPLRASPPMKLQSWGGWGGGPSRPDRLLMEETLPGDVRSEDVIVAVEGNQTETFIMLHRSYDNNVTLMCLTWTSVGVTPDSCRFKFEKTISEFHRAIWACPGCSVKLSDVYTKGKIQTHGSMFKMKLFFMSCVTVLSVVGNVFKSFTSVKVA